MIEVVKEGKTPKNIRQIGQVSGNQKVYLEDYVITYLKQPPTPEEKMRVVILYGKKDMVGEELCWFVNGAVSAEKDFFMEKTVIDQESWQRVNEMAGRFFPEQTVLGWAVVSHEPTNDMEEQILRTQKQFFRPDQKLYFEYNADEKEEYIYLFEKGKMRQQSGYYIYYERNESMQNYMVSLRAAERHPEEFEADRAAHQFRERASEKKQEVHRRKSVALSTCLSLMLMLVIMVIGIAMLNNYEKMQNMEQVLYQISGKIDRNAEEVAEIEEAEEVAVVPEQVEQVEIEEPAPLVSKDELSQNEPESVVEEMPEEMPEEENAEEVTDEEIVEDVTTEVVQQTEYVIQKGDTLAKICMKYYGDISNIDVICEMNGIENKDNILYGQKIILP